MFKHSVGRSEVRRWTLVLRRRGLGDDRRWLDRRGGGGAASDEADAQKNEATQRSGPMSPRGGETPGKSDIDFGPNCDPTTGRVKIPSVYAPPCVEPCDEAEERRGDVGRRDGRRDQDRRVQAPDPPRTRRGRGANSVPPERTNDGQDTWQDYIDLFNQVFELYGRKVSVEFFEASGTHPTPPPPRPTPSRPIEKPFAVAWVAPSSRPPVWAHEIAHRRHRLHWDLLRLRCREGQGNKPYILPRARHRSRADAHQPSSSASRSARARPSSPVTTPRARSGCSASIHYDTPDDQYKGLFDTLKAAAEAPRSTPRPRPVPSVRPLQGRGHRAHGHRQDEGRRASPRSSSAPTRSCRARSPRRRQRRTTSRSGSSGRGCSPTPPSSAAPTTNAVVARLGVALRAGADDPGYQPPVLPLPVVPRLAASEQQLRRDQPSVWSCCERGDARGAPSSRRSPCVTGCSAIHLRAATRSTQAVLGKHGVWPFTDYYGSEDAGMLWWDPTVW